MIVIVGALLAAFASAAHNAENFAFPLADGTVARVRLESEFDSDVVRVARALAAVADATLNAVSALTTDLSNLQLALEAAIAAETARAQSVEAQLNNTLTQFVEDVLELQDEVQPLFSIIEVTPGSCASLQVNANLIVSAGPADITAGCGNLVMGTKETTALISGQNNIILGQGNAVAGKWGIVSGKNNTQLATQFSSVLAGSSNQAVGSNSVIITGEHNSNAGLNSVVVAGYGNKVSSTGESQVVVDGAYNKVAGGSYDVVVDGESNSVSGIGNEVDDGYKQQVFGGVGDVLIGGGGSTFTNVNDSVLAAVFNSTVQNSVDLAFLAVANSSFTTSSDFIAVGDYNITAQNSHVDVVIAQQDGSYTNSYDKAFFGK